MKTKYTFQNKRYITIGVEKEIYSEIQLLLWHFIDKQVNAGLKMDYLQVFKFSRKENKLIIKHSQEKPKRFTIHKALWFEEYESLLGQKVYVIDDLSHSTILLPEER